MRRIALALSIALTACGADPAPGPVAPPPLADPASLPPYQGGYRLPVQGEWRVLRTHYKNSKDQSTAVDLVKRGERGPNKTNQDYPSYGQPIVADGPGLVIVAVDGNPDNVPGVQNIYDQHGNFVVIDHRNGEYSLFAHLIAGSVQVRAGQVVAMGQLLGSCGNSGRSTHPHLHWQIMNAPLAHQAQGVPIRHVPYKRNGQMSTDRLEKGDEIEAVE